MKLIVLTKCSAFRNTLASINFKSLLVILACISPGLAFAQSNTFDGTWIISSDYHYNDPLMEFSIDAKANTVRINAISDQVPSRGTTSFNIGTSITSLNWNRIDTSLDTAMNYTRNISILSVGNPFYHYGVISFIDNLYDSNKASFDCFIKGKCKLNTGEVTVRPKPSRVITEDQLFIGSATHETIKIEEIRFTEKAVEVLLLFTTSENSYSGTLHRPGSDFAFFLRDSKGNKYELLAQIGWEGNDDKNYGSFTIPANTEQHVILYFQPAGNPRTVSNFSLLEGECEANCWNFYDIRLKDK